MTMERNKDDPQMEKARIDYGFYKKIANELLCKLQDQNRHLTRTMDEFTDAVRRCNEAKRILRGK